MSKYPNFDPAHPISVTNIPARPLRTREVAQITGFSPATVRNYINDGTFKAIQARFGSGLRIRHESVREMLNREDDVFGPY